VNRHICRCPSCGSWRTAKTKQLLSPHAGACEWRHCGRCGKETPLREYTVFF
jgi:DNA-directed RNA polymerase subunit RPC12/RpoP